MDTPNLDGNQASLEMTRSMIQVYQDRIAASEARVDSSASGTRYVLALEGREEPYLVFVPEGGKKIRPRTTIDPCEATQMDSDQAQRMQARLSTHSSLSGFKPRCFQACLADSLRANQQLVRELEQYADELESALSGKAVSA